MKKIILIVVLLLGFAFGQLPNNDINFDAVDRIIAQDGSAIVAPDDAPVAVVGRSDGALLCSASLVADRYVITAAHCVSDKNIDYVFDAGLTYYEFRTIPVERRRIAEHIIVHPEYKPAQLDNDIALVILEKAWAIDNPNLAIIPDTPLKDIGLDMRILGIGNRAPVGSPSNYPERFFQVTANLLPDEACLKTIGLFNVKQGICLDETETGASQGDSGGPLFITVPDGKYALCGITSRGNDGEWGIYVEVAAYVDWINKELRDRGLDEVPVYTMDGVIGISTPTGISAIPVPDWLEELWQTILRYGFLIIAIVPLAYYAYRRWIKGDTHEQATSKSEDVKEDLEDLLSAKSFAEALTKFRQIAEKNAKESGGELELSGLEFRQSAIQEVIEKAKVSERIAEVAVDSCYYDCIIDEESVGLRGSGSDIYAIVSGGLNLRSP